MCWKFINAVKSFEDTLNNIENTEYQDSAIFYGLLDKNRDETDALKKINGFGKDSEDFTRLKLEQLLKARECSSGSYIYPFLFLFELFWNLSINKKNSISLNQLNIALSTSSYTDLSNTVAECMIPDNTGCPTLDVETLSNLFPFLSISNNGASIKESYTNFHIHFFNGPYKSLVTLLNLIGSNDDLYEQVLTKNINIDINLVDSFKKEDSSNKSQITSFMADYIQEIYYGSPGSGKSHTVKDKYGVGDKKEFKYRTTFHPDTDYASFVGCYKPITKAEDDSVITYKFIPQIFINAYCEAWSNFIANQTTPNSVILVIEELNRGNCAQIFGDLFQLLDRDENGFSEYKIQADTDISRYLLNDSPLKDKIEEYKELTGSTDEHLMLSLTPNFSIVCTMNTSDQSLFPMDAAFKRRWDWKYVPVNHVDAGKFKVKISDEKIFLWNDEIIEPLNKIIKDITKSDDKQIGNRFVKVRESQKEGDFYIISKEQFVNKVMFYLWTEIFKDYTENDSSLFMKDGKHFSFDDLFKFDSEGKEVEIIEENVLAFINNVKGYKVIEE